MAKGDRPNIILIITDQQFAGAMGCAGNDDVKTPAMDRIAEHGVIIPNAYCSFPVCQPSRVSLMSGGMPHEASIGEQKAGEGVHFADAWKADTMGQLFKNAGYEAAYGGKWHIPERHIPDQEHGFTKISDKNDMELADRCIAFLKKKHDKPFLMVTSFDNPHNICQWAREEPLPWGPVPSAPLEECPDLPANFAIPPYEPEVIRLHMTSKPSVYSTPEYATPDWWRKYRYAYYRLIEKVDREILRILDTLQAEGLADDTLLLFTSDHGDGMGAHQWKQKLLLYEEAVRVPLIMSLKGVTKSGIIEKTHLASGIDVLPTMCDYAGIDVPEQVRGISLRPLAEQRVNGTFRDFVVTQTRLSTPAHTEGRMVRTERYKYIVYSWGRYREQLFDMQKDPGEMVNLAVNSKYSDILNEHRQQLQTWCEASDDMFGESHYQPGKPMVPGKEFYPPQ